MNGEFIPVWGAMRSEVWTKLSRRRSAPVDLFAELYRELASYLTEQPSVEELADRTNDTAIARTIFLGIAADQFPGERAVTTYLETVFDVLVDLGGNELARAYRDLLVRFITRFSLRYQLCEPCILCPTLPGMFASLIEDLKVGTAGDAHLSELLLDFEQSFQTLRLHETASNMKNCIGKQVSLLEGLGQACPGVNGNTLGAIADQLRTWPHTKLRDALKCGYGFASDYPGIRHGGSAKNQIRPIAMRDVISGSILLAGFVPYLADRVDAAEVYRRV